MSDNQRVGLDLEGNFAGKAREAASAAVAAAGGVEQLGAAAAGVKGVDVGGSSRGLKALEGDILHARSALLKLKASEAEAGIGYSSKQRAAEDALKKLEHQAAEGAPDEGGTAGKWLKDGGAAVGKAALELTAAGAGLVAAGVAFGVLGG